MRSLHAARTSKTIGDLYQLRLAEGSAVPCGMVLEEDATMETAQDDSAWLTRHILRNWGSWANFASFRIRTFGGRIAGLHPTHIY